MRRSLPAFSAQSAQIAKSISKSDRSSIASINVSSMISMPAPSASKSHDKGAKREQNPPYSHYNGLTHSSVGSSHTKTFAIDHVGRSMRLQLKI
jgi:hypothetical protein